METCLGPIEQAGRGTGRGPGHRAGAVRLLQENSLQEQAEEEVQHTAFKTGLKMT